MPRQTPPAKESQRLVLVGPDRQADHESPPTAEQLERVQRYALTSMEKQRVIMYAWAVFKARRRGRKRVDFTTMMRDMFDWPPATVNRYMKWVDDGVDHAEQQREKRSRQGRKRTAATPDAKRRIAEMLAQVPHNEKNPSNRVIAKRLGVGHGTVCRMRKEMQRDAEEEDAALLDRFLEGVDDGEEEGEFVAMDEEEGEFVAVDEDDEEGLPVVGTL